VISVTDGSGTKRVTSRRLEALIRALLAQEQRLRLDDWQTGRITLWWAGDEADVESFTPTDFHKRRPASSR
jgi:hypothetical protein